MDIDEFFSSGSDNYGNSEGRDTLSTDTDRPLEHKTKTIRKKYYPFQDNGKVYRYEENPSEYRKIRKKVQNRESATRVRGRKKNAFETLYQYTDYLRKMNTQLQLNNAKLYAYNRTLKYQIDFMRGLIAPQPPRTCSTKPPTRDDWAYKSTDPVDIYLSPEAFVEYRYESPFAEPEWMRMPITSSSSSSWLTLTIFTLLLAVFVLPSDTTDPQILVAYQSAEPSIANTTTTEGYFSYIVKLMFCGKFLLKYAIIFLYVWLISSLAYRYITRKKLKKF